MTGRLLSEVIPEHLDDWPRVYGAVAPTGRPTTFERDAESLGRVFETRPGRR